MYSLLTAIMVLGSTQAFLFGQSLFGGGCDPCYQQWYGASSYQAPSYNYYRSAPVAYNSYNAPAPVYNSYQVPPPTYTYNNVQPPAYNSYRVSPPTYNTPVVQSEGYARPQNSYAQPSRSSQAGSTYVAAAQDTYEQP